MFSPLLARELLCSVPQTRACPLTDALGIAAGRTHHRWADPIATLHALQDVQPEHTQMDKLKGMLRLAFLFIFEGSVELGEGAAKKIFSKWNPLRKFIVATLKEAHGIVDAREATDKKEDNVSTKLCEDEWTRPP